MGQALWAVSFEAGREVGVWVGWFGCDLFLFPSFLSFSSHFLALHFLNFGVYWWSRVGERIDSALVGHSHVCRTGSAMEWTKQLYM